MELSIKSVLYQGISENHWLDILYVNKNEIETHYFIGVKDIDFSRDAVYCDIFNAYKDFKPIPNENIKIFLSKIKYARVLEQSYYPTPKKLLDKIEQDSIFASKLEVDELDNNILRYLADCYMYDNDPYLKDIVMIDGIDFSELNKNKRYKLDKEQFTALVEKVFKKSIYDVDERISKNNLAFNIFSIDISDKQYVVAYRNLYLNFKDRTLRMAEKSNINKSFLIEEEKKVTLSSYLDMSSKEFEECFDEKKEEYINAIASNFTHGEKINTRPNIFLLTRRTLLGVDLAFDAIHQMDIENRLTIPLKAFFGRTRIIKESQKEPNIVIFNKSKINVDQLRVVYNAMLNHVTYVKGPPGTGKTETIFNVLLSAYANDKKVLVCSNNNHPVEDIFNKMKESLFRKKKGYHGHEDSVENIIFPIMRLGNNKEVAKTIVRLKEILLFANAHTKIKLNDEYTEKSKDKSLSGYKELRVRIKEYEDKISLLERKDKLIMLSELTNTPKIQEEIIRQIAKTDELITFIEEKDTVDIRNLAISAQDNLEFQNYIYYSSMSRFMKLLKDRYQELREIIALEDIDQAVALFNKYIKDDKNLKLFLEVFPIIVSTNLSCDRLGSPKAHFDLCIMDEAGQCNIASSLIPIVRATNLLLVGDTNQLQPVTVLEDEINQRLMEKYQIKKEYDYNSNSILSTMLNKDRISKSILLSYHYRCGKKIAGFVNRRFYEEKLRLINSNPGNLLYYNVKNKTRLEDKNACLEEAMCIVDIIKRNKYKDVGIITPFVHQSSLINKLLLKEGIDDVRAGTIHTLQGSEKTTIILSTALSPRTKKRTMEWVKNNQELINVAVTRAKDSFIFVGDKEAIDILSKEEISDIKALSDYVYSNGEYVVPRSTITIMTDFSNNSKNERDFFETISPYFNKRKAKLRIQRNVKVNDAIKNILTSDLRKVGNKEFDVIVQSIGGIIKNHYTTIVAFEIDGGEHVGDSLIAKRDRVKEEICQRYGIKLIRIANSQVKDYELIIHLFECIIDGLPDINTLYQTTSLFEEDDYEIMKPER